MTASRLPRSWRDEVWGCRLRRGRMTLVDSIDCTVASGLQQLTDNQAKTAGFGPGSSSDAAAAAASTVAILNSLAAMGL